MMYFSNRKLALWCGLASVLALSAIVAALVANGRSGQRVHAGSMEADDIAEEVAEDSLAVQTVLPKRSREFVRSVTQPAYVRGMYETELKARVAGPVKKVYKNIGATVKEGEVLVELDVPELVEELAQKDALVLQAEQDARAAAAQVEIVAASVRAAQSQIRARQADVERAAATKKYRESEYGRFRVLASKDAVVAGIVDERLRDLEAAVADWKSAQVAVDVARANSEEGEAKLSAARIDVDVRKARIAVSKADRARTQAMVDFARIRAPYDGIVVARRVDPGDFVQNASTGNPSPVLSIVRVDIVTLVMWVPEKDVAFVRQGTEAVLRLDALGEKAIPARVSRASHLLDPEKSRDMRVEVDVDNRNGLLKPGMYGTMKLVLQQFNNAHVVPTGAVVTRLGKTYVLEVVDGRAHLVPIRVEFEDGVQAKIVKLVPQANPPAGQEEELAEELVGTEEIIRSGQGEIADGQLVRPKRVDW